jgi:hypothetical protein
MCTVLGPSGIFALDVKNWRGTVKPDGKGELLYNDRPTDKPLVRAFVARTMTLKDRFKALTALDPYVQCLFVFPRTRVEANWGTTGAVHCIRIEQVADYIRQGNKHPIAATDLPRLIAAAKALKETITQPQTTSTPTA